MLLCILSSSPARILCVAGHTILAIKTYFSDGWNDVPINYCWYLYNSHEKIFCNWEYVSSRFGRSYTFLVSNCYVERNNTTTDHLTLNHGLGCTSPTFPGSSIDTYGKQKLYFSNHCRKSKRRYLCFEELAVCKNGTDTRETKETGKFVLKATWKS